MPRTAVAIRHVHFEDLGAFRPELEAAGFTVQYRDAGVDDLRALPDADLLVVLGGPIGAYEDDLYPFLAGEIALLERRLASGGRRSHLPRRATDGAGARRPRSIPVRRRRSAGRR